MYVCINICVCVHVHAHKCRGPMRSDKGVRSLGVEMELQVSCLCGCWELKVESLSSDKSSTPPVLSLASAIMIFFNSYLADK